MPNCNLCSCVLFLFSRFQSRKEFADKIILRKIGAEKAKNIIHKEMCPFDSSDGGRTGPCRKACRQKGSLAQFSGLHLFLSFFFPFFSF